MDPLFYLGGVVAAVGLFQGVHLWRNRRPIARVARRYSLTLKSPYEAEGVIDGHAIRVSAPGHERTQISVETAATGLSLRAHGATSMGDDGPLLRTGDAAFDAQVSVYGSPNKALHIFDAQTRDLLATAVVTGLQLRDGVLHWMSPGAPVADTIIRALDLALQTAARVSRPASVDARIDVILGDTQPVALHMMSALPAGPDRAAVDEAVALRATDLRGLVAAQRLGADAVGRLALDATKSDAHRAAALVWLGKKAPEHAVSIARQCLDQSPRDCPKTSRAALTLIGPSQIVSLSALTELANSDRAMVPRALRLAVLHGADAEALLLSHLGDVDPQIAHLAAEGLAQVGTVAAVAALKLRGRFHLSAPPVRQAATDAIDAIHARLAPPGGLSMLDEGAGQVSFAPKSGALSAPETDDDP